MSRPIFESMTQLIVGRHRVRLWRAELHLDAACDPERRDADIVAEQLRRDMCTGRVPVAKMVQVFSELPRVSAIEVTDAQGNGVVKYTDWP